MFACLSPSSPVYSSFAILNSDRADLIENELDSVVLPVSTCSVIANDLDEPIKDRFTHRTPGSFQFFDYGGSVQSSFTDTAVSPSKTILVRKNRR